MTFPAKSVSVAQVVSLLRDQAPEFGDLAVRPSASTGSSNYVFRLGEDLAVRIPRSDTYAEDLAKELEFLPLLRPHLSVGVPDVVFAGHPTDAVPWSWAVVGWLPGEPPGELNADQQENLARTLGSFVAELHSIDCGGLPMGPARWGYRAGEPVDAKSEEWLAVASERLQDLFDPRQIKRAWERLSHVPAATMPPCWIHTDLAAENLLVDTHGDLTGVIDFGGVGIGDRSVDLLYAWSLFDAPARDTLRVSAGFDEATWLRARAWTFVGPGLLTMANYRDNLPERTRRLARMVSAAAAEVGVELR